MPTGLSPAACQLSMNKCGFCAGWCVASIGAVPEGLLCHRARSRKGKKGSQMGRVLGDQGREILFIHRAWGGVVHRTTKGTAVATPLQTEALRPYPRSSCSNFVAVSFLLRCRAPARRDPSSAGPAV